MQLRAAAFSVSVVIAETIGGAIYLLTLSYVIAKYNNTILQSPSLHVEVIYYHGLPVTFFSAPLSFAPYSSIQHDSRMIWSTPSDRVALYSSPAQLVFRFIMTIIIIYYTSLTCVDDDEEWSVIARDGFAHQTNQRSPLWRRRRRLCVSSVHKSLTYVRRSIGELFIFILNWDCGFLGIKKFFMVWRTRSDKIGNGIREGDRGMGWDRGRGSTGQDRRDGYKL